MLATEATREQLVAAATAWFRDAARPDYVVATGDEGYNDDPDHDGALKIATLERYLPGGDSHGD